MVKIEDIFLRNIVFYDDKKLADLKRKIDYIFKDRRPKLIKAINCFLDDYVNKERVKKFSEENIKLYKGYEN